MATSYAGETSREWQEDSSITETNLHMLEHEILYDVTFLAGEEKTALKAHKYMLVSRSPVFYAMFCGPMAETEDAVSIPDIEPETLKCLLRFMYTEDCSVSGDNVLPLLYAAKKYSIPSLVQKCGDFLQKHITIENVCTILDHAIRLVEEAIVEKSLEFINTNSTEVLKSEGLKSLSKTALKKVIESDHLCADEEVVYNACVKWGKHQCQLKNKEPTDVGIREYLGNLLYLIRFPQMAVETFTNTASKDNILSAEEKVSIFQNIVSKSQHHTEFPTCPRNHLEPTQFVIKRVGNVLSGWGCSSGRVDAITVSCSESVILKGVGLFTPCNNGSASGTLEVTDDEDKVLSSKKVELHVVYNSALERFEDVILEPPVRLKKGVKYNLLQSLDGAHIYHGGQGFAEVSANDVQLTFSYSKQSKNGTDIRTGQFYRLLLLK